MLTLYGVPGWGSAISELMFCLCQEPYRFVDVSGFDQPGDARNQLLALNPLAQVPTLQKDDGTVLTESAAIALMLADRHPSLIPPAGTPQRERFYHWLVWLVTTIYPTFTYGDYPQRWTVAGAEELKQSTDAQRKRGFCWLETQIGGSDYLLGDSISLLDAYLPVMVRWQPREAWFQTETPGLWAIAQRVKKREELQSVVARNGL
ncbi:glutathione S-transferase family protein [Candidatus Pantoea deserta]|uniref:Glutathione S-transferase family protein n=1 Tax=Candidatus Pantoea deserta TaxID=1869313 RepID=A0A3N4NIR4_9GAMM|nr:glutathione S-transferase family protein [Pantoea deserta]RPD96111.1 glutathione S-transferase family protein [Pantoea deserta]